MTKDGIIVFDHNAGNDVALFQKFLLNLVVASLVSPPVSHEQPSLFLLEPDGVVAP